MYRYQPTASTDADSDALSLSDRKLESNVPEAESDDAPLIREYSRRRRTRLTFWPVYIVSGQVLLMAVALTILGVTRSRMKIPMSKRQVEFFTDNHQFQTYAFTLLANAVSLFSTWLFTEAVRHAMVIGLTRPMAISTLSFAVKISKNGIIFNRDLKWVAVSVAVFLLSLGQTPGWSSLLTPGPITVYVPVSGTGLDFNDTSLQNVLDDVWSTFLYAPLMDVDILPSFLESGFASANALFGLPAEVDFQGYTHTVSTYGIVPVTLTGDTMLSSEAEDLYKVSNRNEWPPSTNTTNVDFVINQQGVIANVSCTPTTFSELEPPVNRAVIPVADLNHYYIWNISSSCGDDQIFLTDYYNNTLVMVTCMYYMGKTIVYKTSVDGQGRYAGDYQCTMGASIVETTANYTSNGRSISTTPIAGQATAPSNLLDYPAYNVTKSLLYYAQTNDGSIVGDMVVSVMNAESTDTGVQSVIDQNKFAKTLEAYLSGVIELTGTIMKSTLAQNQTWNSTSGDSYKIPTRPLTGHAIVQTLGWEYKSLSSNIVLVPIFILAIATILIALVASFVGRNAPVRYADFDPNDPVLLMAAASAGGMANVFDGMEEVHLERSMERRVRLGSVQGRDAFVEQEDL
ncbi:Protein arginine N-methyltransferase [Mycena chlorophos]|uniref:Protein arginine N-methyltransferase n=1 Tax=Mycena chlorophos TaxID=658473 RepID=A0A8H6SSJ6_MYCCL|nr:Protein arginine N-methyltransferase [Mycena chlorophos]